MPKVDLGVTSPKPVEGDGMRWVEVPERDLFDYPFPTIRINLAAYGPGKHYVDEATAVEIERLVKGRQASDIRTMQPKQDAESQNAMARWGVGRGRGQLTTNFEGH